METAQKIKETINKNVDTLIEEIDNFMKDNRMSSEVEDIPIVQIASDLKKEVTELAYNSESKSQTALRAVTALGALNAQIMYLDARLIYFANVQKIKHSVVGAWNSIKSYIQSIIQSISLYLWQLISQLLTLKEWSVAGNAGVSAFGLTGTVEIELTFGP